MTPAERQARTDRSLDALAERTARRTVELLAQRPVDLNGFPRFVSAADLARVIPPSARWCREHYRELGGWRDASGRIWFDLDVAVERFAEGFGAQAGRRRQPTDLLDVEGRRNGC